MRVLMVTPVLPDSNASSGGAQVMHGQLVALAADHKVTLATFAWGDSTDAQVLSRLRATGIDVHAIAGRWRRRLYLIPAWLRSGWPLRSLRFADPRMQHLVARLLAEERHDLLQVEDSAMGAYQYPTNIPKVLTDHEVRQPCTADEDGLKTRAAPEMLRWLDYQQSVWRRFDRIQVFTQRDAAGIQAMAPELTDRVRINPFGVTLPTAADERLEESGTVVFVGGFMHPPNVDAAVWLGRGILPLLRRRCPGVRLHIVGSYPPRKVRALASDAITVTGKVADVRPFLERAAVVLAPLRIGGGMRVKVLQAMALGKAVVTTPLGAQGLVPTGGDEPVRIAMDAAGLADLTADLLATPAARRCLGRRARALIAEHHSWAAYARREEALYTELQRWR